MNFKFIENRKILTPLCFSENWEIYLYLGRHFFPSNIRSNSHIWPSFMEKEIEELLLLSIWLNRKEWDKGVKLFCPILYTPQCNKNNKRFRSKFLCAVLDKWIFQNFRGPFNEDVKGFTKLFRQRLSSFFSISFKPSILNVYILMQLVKIDF